MKNILLLCILLFGGVQAIASTNELDKSKGTDQETIVSLLPVPKSTVSRYTKIEAIFSVSLDEKHVKKHDIKLDYLCEKKKHKHHKKCKKHKHIKGAVEYVTSENKVTFTPKEALAPGLYEVKFKSLKSDKSHKHTKIKEIKYRFIIEERVLESITVVPGSILLIEGETLQLTVTGKYDNGIEENIISFMEWIVGDSQTVSVDDNGLVTALKAGNTTLKAKLLGVVEAGEVVSNVVPVEVLIPDVIPPVITLNGEKTITLHQYTTYKELGATALDERDGEVNVTIVGTVDTSIVGSYNIIYSAQDSVGNEANITRNITVIDVTPPVVQFNGEENVTLEQNANYTELGATALDAVDGNVNVTISGNVDTTKVGTYIITYTARDNAGNESNSTRIITIIDVTPPVLTLNGEVNITLVQNAVYTELGATALDAVDGDVPVAIGGTVDISRVGNYTITYLTRDSAGNEANVTRSITIIDVTPPVITLNGETSITLEQNAVYTELGATAFDVVDGNVSVTISGNVNTSIVGNYIVMYTARDSVGNEVKITKTITIIDVTPPVISLNGEANVTLEQNANYTELGAIALDVVDGNVNVTIIGTVNTTTVGNYTITYTARDSAGNEANSTRSIKVIDVTPPVLTLNGEANITLEQNVNYNELGANALDAVDGNVNVTISGNVDTTKVGSYTITYTTRDNAGNESNSTRTITIRDSIPPVIIINGSNTIRLFQNANYIELGATATDAVDSDVNVTVSGSVDTGILGTYTLVYSATDNAGNLANLERVVTVVLPKLISLNLDTNTTTLNVGEKSTLTVTGSYEDNSTKELTTSIEWIITPINTLQIVNNELTALKDGQATIQAKVDNVLSNVQNIDIAWIVDGHTLPTEPDPQVNEETLLGIDSNNNGVRDDVERWIYEKYLHPIERGIFMQSARAYNMMIVDPSKAHETVKYSDNVLACQFYWIYESNPRPFDKYEHYDNRKEFKQIQFNSIKRHMAYKRYNAEFNGEVLSAPRASKVKCEFDENGILGEIK